MEHPKFIVCSFMDSWIGLDSESYLTAIKAFRESLTNMKLFWGKMGNYQTK